MAYNLPPPWDPGYALPGNVRDEGLQRRAFVTKQMPRGTYYQSGVGTGGYLVPQYVLDEGYGQGATVTKWAPSGSYPGKAIPHWLNDRPQLVAERRLPTGGKQVTIQRGLSGIQSEPPMPGLFEAYGQRAATMLLDRMTKLPPSHRKTALKATLDKVDPSLWKRTAEIARRYNNQGMTAAQSLHQGLARAMSTGVAAEILTQGAKRGLPQPRSLLGLGAYGSAPLLGERVGLGADRITRKVREDTGAIIATYKLPPSTPWYAPVVDIVKDVGSGVAAVVTTVANVVTDAGSVVGTGVVSIGNAVGSGVATAAEAVGSGVVTAVKEVGGGVVTVGEVVGSGVTTAVKAVGGGIATAGKAVYDVAGKPVEWTVDAAGAVYDAGGKVIGWVKDAAGAVYDAGGKVIGFVKDVAVDVAVAVKDAVKDGLNAIGDLTCDLLSHPAGTIAVAAAAAAAGVPPTVGAAGAGIAKQACSQPPPVPPPAPAPPPPVLQPSVLPVAMLAGGTILAILLLTGKKK